MTPIGGKVGTGVIQDADCEAFFVQEGAFSEVETLFLLAVREIAGLLCRDRHGLRDRGGLDLAQMAGDVMAGEDFAHCRLLLGAAVEGVGQRVWKRQPGAGRSGSARRPFRMMRFRAASGSGTGIAGKSASV